MPFVPICPGKPRNDDRQDYVMARQMVSGLEGAAKDRKRTAAGSKEKTQLTQRIQKEEMKT
jgi:hypothetical protein